MSSFRNVTLSSGISYRGMTWSAAWADFNGDRLPDLWTSAHNQHVLTPGIPGVHLFLNLGGGRFREVTRTQVEPRFKDFHGGAWGDVDNDGDPDFAQMSDANGGIVLWENVADATQFRMQDKTADFGLALNVGGIPGRNPLWLDYNNDGHLDLYLGADATWASGSPASGAILLRQTAAGRFVDARQEVGFDKGSGNTALLSDLNGDGHPELITTKFGMITRVYDTSGPQFVDIKRSFLGKLSLQAFNDMVIADFNNDLRPDIYLTRQGFVDEVVLTGQGQQINAYIADAPVGVQRGFSFASAGDLTFTFSRQDGSINYDMIRVGAAGRRPITNELSPSFTLSSDDTSTHGIPTHLLGRGIYIGYQQATDTWEYLVVGTARPSRGMTISSTAPIQNLTTEGITQNPLPAGDQLLINRPGGFVDASASSGIAAMSNFGNFLAAADFDNDGDVDIYVDQASPAMNRPNILLVNDGTGTFTRVTNFGASGSSMGTGGAVALGDYDSDGFLDIATTAGAAFPPFIPLNNGPIELFRNLGNADNHYIKLQLHGVLSNIDGIGSKVIVTAGGGQQMREALNGMHLKAQDYSDIHFGLGQSTIIDQLEVRWPSGAVTILHDVPADQTIEIIENASASTAPDLLRLLPEDTGSVTGMPADASMPASPGVSADEGGSLSFADPGSLDFGIGDWLFG